MKEVRTSKEYRKLGLGPQEINNIFYGHALDIADEMGCFHAVLEKLSSLVTTEQLERYCKFLKAKGAKT